MHTQQQAGLRREHSKQPGRRRTVKGRSRTLDVSTAWREETTDSSADGIALVVLLLASQIFGLVSRQKAFDGGCSILVERSLYLLARGEERWLVASVLESVIASARREKDRHKSRTRAKINRGRVSKDDTEPRRTVGREGETLGALATRCARYTKTR